MNSGDISYLPFNQALVLEGVEDESEELRREVKELRYIMKDRFMDLNLRFDAIEVSNLAIHSIVILKTIGGYTYYHEIQ